MPREEDKLWSCTIWFSTVRGEKKKKKEKMIREYDFIWIPNRKQTTIVNSVQFTVQIIITIL